jgi:hypothetical protein
MLKSAFITMVAAFVAFSAAAQKKEDVEAIKKLCGCFGVTFNYAETFTNDTAKKRFAHPMDNFPVTEYAYPIEESTNKVVIQHLLVIPDGEGTVIKHWREDWQYEQREMWQFVKGAEWKKVSLPASAVKGQWTQSVWEVSDAPRYTGSSEWVRTNNQTFWLNSTDAPLPRREYTTRKDYNVMNRTNRIIVSENGYMHEQDNKKIIREAGAQDSLLAEEKGYNKYVRLPDSSCALAKTFWSKPVAAYWKDVRKAWDDKMSRVSTLSLQNKVDGKSLIQRLEELAGNPMAEAEKKAAISALLSQYLGGNTIAKQP